MVQGKNTIKILVADDEENIRLVYQKCFKNKDGADYHFDVTVCSQGDEAAQMAQNAAARCEPYHIAFLDIRMPPGPDGLWTAEKIRNFSRSTEIVIVTAYSDIKPAEMVEKIPPIDKLIYLQKPFHMVEITHLAISLGMKWRYENHLKSSNLDLEAKLEMAGEGESEHHEIEHSARLASVGELTTGVVHEIKNPLAIIQGFVELIAEETKNSPVKLDEHLGQINEAIGKINLIMEDIRSVAHYNHDADTKFDAHEILETTLDFLEKAHGKNNIKITSTLNASNSSLVGNIDNFKHMILNLVSNAKDATTDDKACQLEVTSSNEDDYLVIEFKDNGCGIKPENSEHIFRTFFSTKQIGKGTGLGLPITKLIVTQFGGTISFDSVINEGTSFKIRIPNKK